MNKDDKTLKIIHKIILCIYLIGTFIASTVIVPKYLSEYSRIANLLIWVGLFAIFREKNFENIKNKRAKIEKIKLTIIIVIIYYMFYFLLGIPMGFTKNPYSMQFTEMIKNIIFISGVVALQEYVRATIVRKSNIYTIIAVTIIFFAFKININDITVLKSDASAIFKYICGTLVLELCISVICSYLSAIGGIKLTYAFILPRTLIEVVSPVFPDINWFILMVLQLVLIIIIFFYNNYEQVVETNNLSIKELKKQNPVKAIPYILILLLLVAFVTGMLEYKPVAIMSDSMIPVFYRGSAVIIKKVKNCDEIKKEDIIEFSTEKGTFIHRVVDIEKDEANNILFTVKGDNNDSNDPEKIEENQVTGIATYSVRYLGYPTVWFYELVLRNIK